MRSKKSTNEINMILLAAGNSRRFGSNKLLAEFQGKPLYRHTVDLAVEVKKALKKEKVDGNMIIVTQYAEILNCGIDLGICTIENQEPELGISNSIRLGLEAGEAQSIHLAKKAYLFFVCDQPCLTANSVMELIESYLESDKKLGCLACNHQLGNPCIFDESYREQLKKLQGDTGGKIIINKNIDDTLIWEIDDEKELKDIDTAGDLF